VLDVAFLLPPPDISGGSNVIFEHAAGLGARGHRVALVSPGPVDPGQWAWHPAASELEFCDLARCRERPFDVAVATWFLTVLDLRHLQARRQAYLVQSIETRFAAESDPESAALADFTYRLPLPVVTEATWIVRHLAAEYGRDATLVRNGMRKDLFTPHGPRVEDGPAGGLRVLVEGPLDVPHKRVELAIQLCHEAGIQDVWLLTRTPCNGHSGVRRVFSRVPLRDTPTIYRSCDVLLKLSTVEGMFGPPLEMMHCGGTCITSDVSGHDEYVRDGENALVVPIGEERRTVAALRRLAGESELLARLRRGALATAAAWPAWDVAAGEMEAFLSRVARGADDPAAARGDASQVLAAALELAVRLRAEREGRAGEAGRPLLQRAKGFVQQTITHARRR
jgi:glycosyltransferase involved in cell wall biosynthesis